MIYKRLELIDEDAYRTHWKQNLVTKSPIITPDGINVSLKPSNWRKLLRKRPDDSYVEPIFCPQRAVLIDWVVLGLTDPAALPAYFGHNPSWRDLDYNRRVAFVQGNYGIIIRFTGFKAAEVVTAYPFDPIPLALARSHPFWDEKQCDWMGGKNDRCLSTEAGPTVDSLFGFSVADQEHL